MQETELRQIPLTALIIALAVIFPQFFHLLGLGSAFLPMFLPVMIGSMFLTWRFVLLIVIIAPLTSWMLTGMPPLAPPVLPVMMVELLLIGLLISFARQKSSLPVWLITILAVATDRSLLFLIIVTIAPMLEIRSGFFNTAVVLAGMPGSVVQLIVVPATVLLIEKKYPHWKVRSNNQ